MENLKLNRIDEIATKLALKYFAIVNFVLLPYDEFEEKKGGMVTSKILIEKE